MTPSHLMWRLIHTSPPTIDSGGRAGRGGGGLTTKKKQNMVTKAQTICLLLAPRRKTRRANAVKLTLIPPLSPSGAPPPPRKKRTRLQSRVKLRRLQCECSSSSARVRACVCMKETDIFYSKLSLITSLGMKCNGINYAHSPSRCSALRKQDSHCLLLTNALQRA